MTTSPAYRDIVGHREAGLAATTLLVCTPWAAVER
jgi:hypothetical protein